MNPILVQAAVPAEIELLVSALEGGRSDNATVSPVTTGFIGETFIACAVGGVGKANAAATTAALIERHHPEMVIITGCGGAYPGSGLSVGDLAVASDEIFADEGVAAPDGWHDLSYMRIPLYRQGNLSCYNTIPLSRHAAEKSVRVAEAHGVRLARGRFLTVSTCSGTAAGGIELARTHQAICENMEGAAIALVALRYGIPCLEIRGISNLVEDRDISSWDIPAAVEAAQRMLLKIIEEHQRSGAHSMSGRAIP